MEKTMGKNSMFGKIESKEHAIKVINHISKVFVIIGAFQIFFSFIIQGSQFESRVEMTIIGLVYLCLGFLFGKLKKTIIAVILLLLSLTSVVVTSMNLFGIFGNTQNRGLPIMAIAIAIASSQGIKAARKYNKEK